MRKLVVILISFFALNVISQETISIKGKLFFSEEFYNTFSNLLVHANGSKEFIQIKEDGLFEIKTSQIKENYKLIFFYGNIKIKEYNYKFEWTKHNRHKSISLAGKCKIGKINANNDFTNKSMKLFYYNLKNENLSKRDLRFQKKYNIKYKSVSLSNIKNYQCFLDYNRRIFLILSLRGKKEIKNLKHDVLGYNARYAY